MRNMPTAFNVLVDGRRRRVRSLASQLVGVEITFDDDSQNIEFFEDVEKMFSTQVVEWLVDKHHPRVPTVNIAVRWGLADSDGKCVKLTDDNSASYQVTCCVLASGKING